MSAGESVKNLMLSGLGVAAAFFLYFVFLVKDSLRTPEEYAVS